VTADWPLIRFLLDDPVYAAAYGAHLAAAAGLLDAEALQARYQAQVSLIRPYVARESSAEAFDAAVDALFARVAERALAVAEYLKDE
jgi:hypothetical protein